MTAAFETVPSRLYRNVEEALVGEAALILEHGHTVRVRGATTRELLARTFTITQPLQRVVALAHRQNHLAATVVDTLWVLSGRNDIAAITPYLPRASQFSDDGATWRGGYGPRLRRWHGTDQLDYARRVLLDEPTSRRAVISLYNPASDSVFGPDEAQPSLARLGHLVHHTQSGRADGWSEPAHPPDRTTAGPRGAQLAAPVDARLDVPCNNWLHFLLRDGRLDLFVAARSNDLMWGFSGINAFQWSVLQELMARWVGASVGRQHWSVSSMHLYEQHLERARSIVSAWDGTGTYTPSNRSIRYEGGWDRFDSDLNTWFGLEQEIRTADEPRWDAKFTERIQDPFLLGCLMIVEDYWRARASLPPDVDRVFRSAAAAMGTDLVAALRSFRQQRPSAAGGAAPGDRSADVSAPEQLPAGQSGVPTRGQQGSGQPTAEEIGRLKDDMCVMHRMKSAAYGDSWKRRGELLGVLPNVARKIDRLRNQVNWYVGDSESEADTWADLVIYLLKYQTLLGDLDPTVAARLFGSGLTDSGAAPDGNCGFSDGVTGFELLLSALTAADEVPSPHVLDADLDALQKLVEISSPPQARADLAGRMARGAFAGLVAVTATDAGQGRSDR